MLPRLAQLTTPGGLLILSGLLDSDENDTTAALEAIGLKDMSILRDNKWLTYTVTRS